MAANTGTSTPATTAPIVIFDSGVGGLSIFQEIHKQLPDLPVVYCSDNAGFPYGPRSEAFVIQRTRHCLERLVEQYQPQLAVIACNTASTVALPHVRNQLDIPIVGVVPAIKTAAKISQNRHIGLLATPATVEREYTRKLIADFAADCEVISVGSTELVHLAEEYLQGKPVSDKALQAIIKPFTDAFVEKNSGPDTIVLGCTHFPLLHDALASLAPEHINWIDSGNAIARRVASLIPAPADNEAIAHIAAFTGEIPVNGLVDYLQKRNFRIQALDTVTS